MLQIRDFEERDLAAVLRLNVEADGPEPDLNNFREVTVRAYRNLLDIKSSFADGAFLVGLEADEIVAMAGVRRLEASTFEMNFVRVDFRQQGKGMGRRIAVAVEDRARSLGASRIELITTTRQVPAQKLYAALGYQVIGNSIFENGNGRFELLHYAKDLAG